MNELVNAFKKLLGIDRDSLSESARATYNTLANEYFTMEGKARNLANVMRDFIDRMRGVNSG
jgi:hypothetical protein